MMIIDVLECRADGTQELVKREVPDDYFPVVPDPEEPADGDLAERVTAVEADLAGLTAAVEKGLNL